MSAERRDPTELDSTGLDGTDSPHPWLAERLAAGPAERVADDVGPDGRPVEVYAAYAYDAVRAALADDALSSSEYQEHMALDRRHGPLLIGMDGDEHRDHRAVLQPRFARSAVDAEPAAAVDEPILGLLPDPSSGRADLAGWCERFPPVVLARLLGLDDAVAPLLARQVPPTDADEYAAALVAADELHDVLAPVIAARRLPGADGADLITLLANATIGTRPLTDDEVFAHVRLLAIAGSDTAARATAVLLFALLAHPGQLAAVAADRSLLGAAIEESIRWDCPPVAVPRVAVRSTTVGGLDVPVGATVRCYLAAANRDPSRWPEPARFDLHRERRSHVGFGVGAHACLGMHLARRAMAAAVVAVLDTLPGVRFDADVPPPTMTGAHLRGPSHLCVRWDPHPSSG